MAGKSGREVGGAMRKGSQNPGLTVYATSKPIGPIGWGLGPGREEGFRPDPAYP